MKVSITVEKIEKGVYRISTDKDEQYVYVSNRERAIRAAMSILAEEIFVSTCNEWKNGDLEEIEIDKVHKVYHKLVGEEE